MSDEAPAPDDQAEPRPEPKPAAEPAKPKPAGGTATTAKPKRSLAKRIGLGVLVATPVVGLGLWIAIHKVEWLGPALADLGRSIIGNDAIAKLEDWAYGIEDQVNQVTRGDEKPVARWEVPAIPSAIASADAPKAKQYPSFAVANVEPMHASFAAPGDGVWIPVPDARQPDEPAPMFKTLLHPDAKRGWANVAVVAVDLRQVRLSLVAGMHEPMSKKPEAKGFTRTGLVAPEDLPRAIAAFNGGFKTTHGNYGMKAHGVLFVDPRVRACTVAMYAEDRIAIRSWEELEPTKDTMLWFRQTPMCMYESGEMHEGLRVEQNTHWGATLDKDTVIRRSAIGLDQEGKVLYVGISEATTATAIAKAMHHAGAAHVAQLDVNWSYPKFVTIEPRDGDAANPYVKAIIDGFEYGEDDYVKKPMSRDFFYLARKPPAEVAKAGATDAPVPSPTPQASAATPSASAGPSAAPSASAAP
jgi:hypothetical protein